jgi:hypothetical protein
MFGKLVGKTILDFINKIYPMRTVILALSLSLLYLSSCKKDNCDKCQEAIDFMFVEIINNNCDPDQMAAAKQDILNECTEERGREIIGFLAEQCINHFNDVPICEVEEDLYIDNTFFVLTTSTGTNQDLKIKLITPNNSEEVEFPKNATFNHETDLRFLNQMVLTVEIRDKTGKLLKSSQKPIEYWRPGNFTVNRIIDIKFDQATGYSIGFDNW